MSKSTARQGNLAGSRVNSASNGRAPHGAGGDHIWSPAVMLASELDVDPDEAIYGVVDSDTWKAFRLLRNRFGIDVHPETTFAQLDAIWPPIWNACALDPPTADAVAEFVAEYAHPLTDPQEAGRQLEVKRQERFREQDRTEQALKQEGVPAARLFTIDEVRAGAGDGAAEAALTLIERANRRAWNTQKLNDRREHEYLISAGELYRKLRVSAPDIARMVAATEADRDTASHVLAVARRRHQVEVDRRAKVGDVTPLDLASETLSISALAAVEPVTPLIEGFLYRGQLAELIGNPGTGKTFAALGMALALSTGRRWCNYGVPAAVPVVYVAAEGVSGLYTRVLAW